MKKDAATAWATADSLLSQRGDVVGVPGAYLAFETAPDASLPDLQWKRPGIRLAAAKRDDAGKASGAIFVPDDAREFLYEKLTAYALTEATKNRFAPIERFSAARLETLWVDSRPAPADDTADWWECWCWPDRVHNVELKAEQLGLPVSAERLHFPEREVVFVYGTAVAISRLVSSTDAVGELRLGRDTAATFLSAPRADQDGWVQSLEDLLIDERAENAPAVCLLDTGVNRGHPLIAPFLLADDMHSLRVAWGVDDHDGHGTELAGLAIHGDLVAPLQSLLPMPQCVNLESVKVLPPKPFPATAPGNFGLVTLQGVALPEIAKPDRARVFCLAIGQDGVTGPRASSWSAAIDQAAFGTDDAGNADRRRRLFIVAAGNVPDGLKLDDLKDWDDHELEDPGQSWNALTVGGVTEKASIAEPGHDGWSCAVGVDELSPYSRVSASWNRSVSPIKPELVMEAGNRGVDPADATLWSGIPSLSLLTTGHDVLSNPLIATWATSAATAQIAGIAAKVQADDEDYWPETVRALLVQSARWTAPMQAHLDATPQKGERLTHVRRFGYGRPNMDRARHSRASAMALISQSTLQPFRLEKGKAKMNEFHFYQLPWPKEGLAVLAEHMVRLRVTLSYFIDPNPSADAPLSPARYRSFGLRFALRKKNEPTAAFMASFTDVVEGKGDPDSARLFGRNSIAAGSLHFDEWYCTAADLIDRDCLAIYPVGGWWKESKSAAIANQKARYSLVVTLDAGESEQDLYVEIEQAIAAHIAAEIEI